MTSRERVKAVLRGDIPDRVPRAIYGTSIGIHNPETLKLFDQKTGKHPREAFKQDIIGAVPDFYKLPEDDALRQAKETYARSCKSYRPEGVRTFLPEDLENQAYRHLFMMQDRVDMAAVKRRVDEIHAHGYASVLCGQTLFDRGKGLRKMEQFLMDLAEQPDWLEPFLDLVTDRAVEKSSVIAEAKPDIICGGDDIGTQRGLLISPRLWCDLFKPRLKRVVDAVKEVEPGIAYALHCCGDSRDLIPHLIDIGVDILNPIQPAAIDPAEARRLAGDKLVLWGGVCVQHTMPHGTPEDVHREVKLRMETIGKDGRYLLTPAHMINADIPWENIVAFFEAADKHGGY